MRRTTPFITCSYANDMLRDFSHRNDTILQPKLTGTGTVTNSDARPKCAMWQPCAVLLVLMLVPLVSV